MDEPEAQSEEVLHDARQQALQGFMLYLQEAQRRGTMSAEAAHAQGLAAIKRFELACARGREKPAG